MNAALAGLEPAGVWERFGELTRIPRPPRGEERAREHVLAWAEARGYEHAVDDAGNAIVRVPASSGREAAETVVLQAHLDMVCERDPASPYDPRAGRIHVVRDGDWVRAEGTTLGADNGIGVALALAAADDAGVAHGPLELLFTVCEEEGLEGAKALDAGLVAGRLLVNLDGTSDDAITIGCAGSAHTFARIALAPAGSGDDSVALRVAVSGGRGGHSGGDIAKGRANAIAALGQVLGDVLPRVPFELARLDGGVSRNAIPREAEATVVVHPEHAAAFGDAAREAFTAVRDEHAGTDGEIALAIDPIEPAAGGGDKATEAIVGVLGALPAGVVAMREDAPGTVETSTSPNVVRTENGVLTLASMSRSSSRAGLEAVVAAVERACRAHGAEVDVRHSYPPWEPDPGSGLLASARSAYERLFSATPGLEVVHGGLECAVLGAKLDGVQMISLGPLIEGPHAPGERVSVSSTERCYRLLAALLDDLSDPSALGARAPRG